MSDEPADLIRQMARLAADAGPAIVPVGHRRLLATITDTAKRLFNAKACSIALLTDDEDELEFVIAAGAGADSVQALRIPASEGIAGWVVMSGQAIAVDDVQSDARFARETASATGYVPRSILAMPLQTDRRVLGVIEVLDRGERGDAVMGDMELLSLFAAVAALAIESSAVFRDLGRELLQSMSAASTDARLATELRRGAEDAPTARAELAEIATLLQDIGDAGPRFQRFTIDVLRRVLGMIRESELE